MRSRQTAASLFELGPVVAPTGGLIFLFLNKHGQPGFLKYKRLRGLVSGVNINSMKKRKIYIDSTSD